MSRIGQLIEANLPKSIHHPAMKVAIPLAAVGPAALFGILWRLLNLPMGPYIGEGCDSPASSLIAAVCFYFGVCGGFKKAWNDKNTDGSVMPYVQRVYWQLVTTCVAIPGGRILFSILPPWDNALGGVIGIAIAFSIIHRIFDSERGRFIHERGTVLLSTEEAECQIRSLPAGPEPRIRFAGHDLPGEIAIGNIITAGSIGTGKTRLHRELIASIVPHIMPDSDLRMLAYDVKCDLLAELFGMHPRCEVVVLNPFDRRSSAWDAAADVRTPEQSRQFAEAFIGPAKAGENPFFPEAARNITAGVIDKLNRLRPGQWTLRDVLRITASKERLRRLLTGTDLIGQYFEPRDTFDNIRQQLANATVPLEPVAALYERSARKISLRQWVKTGGSILVLGGKENLQASLQPLNRIVFAIISTEFLSEPESPTRARLWFFNDELKSAGRLETLPQLLNARSKGVRCVLGFQDLEGLTDAYGSKERAFEIVNRCATMTCLKLTSTETAEWASHRTGEFERFEYFETQTKDGKNVGEHLTKREAILPSEFLNLPDFHEGKVAGIHLIRGVNGVFKSTSHRSFSKTDKADDFHPRDEREQELAPWTDADEIRLGVNSAGTNNNNNNSNNQSGEQASAEIRLDEPDLRSLGRVSL